MDRSGFIDLVQQIVYGVLHNEGALQNEWHTGVVTSVISSYALSVQVDGSSTSQTIPCNPNIKFVTGDNVFVQFVNGDSKNKFVPYKKATGTEDSSGGSGAPPQGDMMRSVYDTNLNGIVDNAEALQGKTVDDAKTSTNNLWTAQKISDTINSKSGAKISGGTAGNLLTIDSSGNIIDSGNSPSSFAPSSHVGSGGNAHALVTDSVAGFMSASDKTKLDGIATGATLVQSSSTNGNVKINGVETTVYTPPSSSADTDAVISTTQPTTGLYDGLIWFEPNSQATKFYLNGAFRDIGTNSNVKTVSISNNVTLASASNTATIGISEFSNGDDNLLVFQNSVFITNYTISGTGSTATITTSDSSTWASGTQLSFVVLKNVATSNIYADGSMITANSIPNSALATDAKVGSLSTLTTNTKTDTVSAINEINANKSGILASVDDAIVHSATGTFVSLTPPKAGNYIIYMYLRVIGVAGVTISITYNDNTGAQSQSILSGQTQQIGSYTMLPVFINAATGAPIVLTANCTADSQAYLSVSVLSA